MKKTAVITSVLSEITGMNEHQDENASVSVIYLSDTSPESWKNAVRKTADDGANKFIFIGKGRNISAPETDVALVADHINLSGKNPLIGPNNEKYGVRFPDMTDLYSEKIRRELSAENIPEVILLAPRDPENLTALEKNVISSTAAMVISGDIIPGVVTAKHLGGISAALVVLSENKIPAGLIHRICSLSE